MNAYLIAEIEVIDPERYAEYARQARPLVEAYGGRYLVQGGSPREISGGWSPERVLVLEFPSPEAMAACFGSDSYRRIAPLREESTRSRAIMVEGSE